MIQRFEVGPRMSELAVYNGVAYLAGQVPEDTSLDIVGQTREVLEAIDALLAQAGTDKTRILRAQTVMEVQGGGSSLVGGYGATANFWRNGVDGWIGLGGSRWVAKSLTDSPLIGLGGRVSAKSPTTCGAKGSFGKRSAM